MILLILLVVVTVTQMKRDVVLFCSLFIHQQLQLHICILHLHCFKFIDGRVY